MPDLRLTTQRLTLRPVTTADRADLMALEADPQVMAFLNGGVPVPETRVPNDDFLTPRGHEPEVMAAHHGTRFIGWFAVFDDGLIDGLRTAEIGYRLTRAAWGQGYATEVTRALIARALNDWGFDAVRAQTMAVNLASRRVMEKSGMTLLKTVYPDFTDPIPGSDQGEVIYEIRRPTF